MKKKPKEEAPDPKAFDRFKELTKKLLGVPKRDVAKKARPQRG